MKGAEHLHDDSHDHGQAGSEPTGPSEAARMVCSGDVVDDVTRIMAVDAPVEPSSSWERPMFTCTFALRGGKTLEMAHAVASSVLACWTEHD